MLLIMEIMWNSHSLAAHKVVYFNVLDIQVQVVLLLPHLQWSTSSTDDKCKKNIGELKRWSRGHQVIVRAGGHIESW